MKDILSYIRAAYAYEDKASDKLAEINSVLGDAYDTATAPDMSASSSATAPEGTGFSGVTFHLGEAPAYRFYYEGTAPAYTFTVGTREITATAGSDSLGTYLEVKVYAYELLLGVSFGENAYSIYAYYNWLTETANGTSADAKIALKAIPAVERLVKYCESASAYKASVTQN